MSCENNPSNINHFISSEELPVEELFHTEIQYTENGIIKVRVFSNNMQRFVNDEDKVELSGGVHFDFFKLDNKMTVKEGTVRRNDLPSYNLEQVKRRLKAYHTDFYNALYNPDGSSKPQDEVNKNLEQLGFGQ